MQEIPNWIIKVIKTEKLICRTCKEEFEVENLVSIGIQESSEPPHKDKLCIGMFCSRCKEIVIFELRETTLVNFAFEILDQETDNKIKKISKKVIDSKFSLPKDKKRKRSKRSKITLKEIEEIRKFLKPKDLKHEEFLIALGMSPSEIKKYNYKRTKPEK